jgi:hypothetical protein
MEPDRRAVTKEHFYDALETIKIGEILELHHPESKGKPTNMGVLCYERKNGEIIRLYAGCWGMPSDSVVAWFYSCLEITENAGGMGRELDAHDSDNSNDING